jgi:hypothetical protein
MLKIKISLLTFLILKIILFVIFNLIILEVIAIIFTKDPEADNIVKICSKDEQLPYISENQCFKSQGEIADMEYNTFVGYIPIANRYGVGWYTNMNHFRYDKDLTQYKKQNEFRIFITGGSTAWGAGVLQHQTYAHLLEKKLNAIKSNKYFRVIIAAAGAWTSSQEKVFVFNYIKDFEPDIVIMFSGWNDIYHAYTGTDFNKEQDFLYYKKSIYKSKHLLKPEARNIEKNISPFEIIAPPRYSEYYSKVWYIIDLIRYKWIYNKNNLLSEVNKISLASNKIVENTIENIDLVQYLSKKKNFKLIYYLQPTIYYTKKALTNWEKQILQNSYNNYIGYPNFNKKNYPKLAQAIKNDAKEKCYLFIEGDNAINNEVESVFVDHVHFGDRGNILIANHLYKILLDSILQDLK